jgi:hypothetical protein
MENQNKWLAITILSIIIPLLLYLLVPHPKTQVLSGEIVATPTPTPTESPTPTPTETPTPLASPKPTAKAGTPIPTPTPIGSPKPVAQAAVPPSEINALIDRFSAQYGVDPNVMRHIAICESGFNPLAKRGAYVGLYQFGPITWQNLRKEIGEDINLNLRYSAEESAQTAAYALSQGKRGIWPNCNP